MLIRLSLHTIIRYTSISMKKVSIRTYVSIASSILLVGFIWLERDTFVEGTRELANANIFYATTAIVVALLAVAPAAYVYQLIAVRPLIFKRTILVQMANNFSGKILPSGTGNIATMVRYLTTQKHSVIEASSIVSVNYLASFLGILCATIVSLIASGKQVQEVFNTDVSPIFFIIIGVLIGGFLLAAFLPSSKSKIRANARKFWKVYLMALSHGWRFAGAVLCAASLSILLVICLILSVNALGGSILPLQALIALTLGVTAAAITPTPGSLGGAEIGLMLALEAAGVPSSTALPSALLFRFATFWIPMIPGFFAFQYALKKKYL